MFQHFIFINLIILNFNLSFEKNCILSNTIVRNLMFRSVQLKRLPSIVSIFPNNSRRKRYHEYVNFQTVQVFENKNSKLENFHLMKYTVYFLYFYIYASKIYFIRMIFIFIYFLYFFISNFCNCLTI